MHCQCGLGVVAVHQAVDCSLFIGSLFAQPGLPHSALANNSLYFFDDRSIPIDLLIPSKRIGISLYSYTIVTVKLEDMIQVNRKSGIFFSSLVNGSLAR